MAVCILEDERTGYKAMYCTTTMWAFGGIFYGDEEPEKFIEWLGVDPRTITDADFECKMSEWRCEVEKNNRTK